MLAQALSEHDQKTNATAIARVVLNRAARTTEQLGQAFAQLQQFAATDPCSDQSLARMREIDLGSSLLQGVGFASGNELECSSIDGRVPSDLGPPDFVSRTGQAIRQRRELSFARDTPLLVVTAPSGLTGFVHPALIFEMTDGGDDLPTGIVGFSTRRVLLSSKPIAIDWSTVAMAGGQMEGTTVVGDQLVAWVRSKDWDQFSFAAVPWAMVTAEFRQMCLYLLPLGAVGSLLALWLLRRLEEGRSSLPALLRTGLRRNEILLFYQPIVDMRSGHWVGAEVLARWRRRSGEWVSPDIFVPIAEKHGLITQLTRFVIARAISDMAQFMARHPAFFLSINVSSTDLGDPGFSPYLVGQCAAAKLPHGAVHLEITERQEVDIAAEGDAINALRSLGFQLGTDDFGVGFSNLAYLESFQLDYLKVDRVFVANAFRAGAGAEMIDYIIGVGKARHLQIIAEGVENSEQQRQLLARGVSLDQGWLFAKGMPALEFLLRYQALRQVPELDERAA